mgnify:CR=1 FL=1|tara:strand:- start:1052 stop:1300 length:249 start_codon:yes stop_codon:yes gene_type:complete
MEEEIWAGRREGVWGKASITRINLKIRENKANEGPAKDLRYLHTKSAAKPRVTAENEAPSIGSPDHVFDLISIYDAHFDKIS